VSSESNLGSLGMEKVDMNRSATHSGASSRTGSLSKARKIVAEGMKSPLLSGMKLDEIRETFNKGVELQCVLDLTGLM
jgi:hypothetical protein